MNGFFTLQGSIVLDISDFEQPSSYSFYSCSCAIQQYEVVVCKDFNWIWEGSLSFFSKRLENEAVLKPG